MALYGQALCCMMVLKSMLMVLKSMLMALKSMLTAHLQQVRQVKPVPVVKAQKPEVELRKPKMKRQMPELHTPQAVNRTQKPLQPQEKILKPDHNRSKHPPPQHSQNHNHYISSTNTSSVVREAGLEPARPIGH